MAKKADLESLMDLVWEIATKAREGSDSDDTIEVQSLIEELEVKLAKTLKITL